MSTRHIRQILNTLTLTTTLTLTLTLATTRLTAQTTPTTGPLNFTFIHTSDAHVSPYHQPPDNLENARSWKAVRTLKNIGSIFMTPYSTLAHTPSFIINTGDITEFGFPGATTQVVERYFGDLGLPVYYTLGNHDSTWTPPFRWMHQKFGGINYSFNFLGVHFLSLNTAGIQDPLPSLGQETINFARQDLAKISKSTPVIVFFHHPLTGSEWSSTYDYERLLDELRPYNILVMLMGHGHSARLAHYGGIPTVMGGSTFSKNNTTDGYNIIHLDGKEIRIAYRQIADDAATKPLLQRTIPKESYYPDIKTNITQTGTGDQRQIILTADIRKSVYTLRSPRYVIDDILSGPMTLSGNTATATIPASQLDSGVHFARFTIATSQAGVEYSKSAPFAVEHGVPGRDPVAAWRYQMGGGSRTKPLHHNNRLYVGSNDGILHAINPDNGQPIFKYDAKSPIIAAPEPYKDLIIFGAGDGKLRAITQTGQLRWEFDAGDTIAAHPLVANDKVYFARNSAIVYCLDAATGNKIWEYRGARDNIETKPVLHNDKLYFGAWDGNIYCIDANTGGRVWSQPGPRNQGNNHLPTYYAPADAPLVIQGDRIYAADRAYQSGAYTLDGQYIKDGPGQAAAFAPSADGKHLYLRRSNSPVIKLDQDLNTIWESKITAGTRQYPPVESNGTLYGVTSTGTLYALNTETGNTLWTYQVSPKLYVHASPTIANNTIYTVSQDGIITAIKIPQTNQSQPTP